LTPQQSKNEKELRLWGFFPVLLAHTHNGFFFSPFFGLAHVTQGKGTAASAENLLLSGYVAAPTRAFCQTTGETQLLGTSATPAQSQPYKPCQQTRHKQDFRQANRH